LFQQNNHRKRAMTRLNPSLLLLIPLLLVPGSHQAAAEGAVALGVPPDVSKAGIAYGRTTNAVSPDTAHDHALTECRTSQNAPQATRDLCAVIRVFHRQCVAFAMDPKDGTPGWGFAIADNKTQAEQSAMANCAATAGTDRVAFCVVSDSACDQSDAGPTPSPSGAAAPTNAEAGLTPATWARVQRGLAALGLQPGPADGAPGPATRDAIRQFQTQNGHAATGYLDSAELSSLLAQGQAGSAPLVWRDYHPSGAGFHVDLPGVPRAEVQTVPNKAWGQVELHQASVALRNDTVAYQAMYNDYPPAFAQQSPDGHLDQIRDGAVRYESGHLRSEIRTTIAGWPARRIIIDHIAATGNWSAYELMVLSGARLYQMIHVTPTGQENQADIDHFFASFRLDSAAN
jgi:peptidoglycan hydrolase-like protein with peptidoglycan-binding domain